jgi:hypothetical protein
MRKDGADGSKVTENGCVLCVNSILWHEMFSEHWLLGGECSSSGFSSNLNFPLSTTFFKINLNC